MIYKPLSIENKQLLNELKDKVISENKKEDRYIKDAIELIKTTNGFSDLEKKALDEGFDEYEIRYLLNFSYGKEIEIFKKLINKTLFIEVSKDDKIKDLFRNILKSVCDYNEINREVNKEKLHTNVLVIGKSGVGKSSLINYIYGEKVRDEGAGKPVTNNGLHLVKHEVENLIVYIYDTWGLEANKSNDWKEEILSELNKSNKKDSIKDWIHTIYYCFSASSARIEDFEIDDILRPLINEGNKICIVITHCDISSNESNAEAMKCKLIKELNINKSDIIKVSSASKKLLGQKSSSTQFGKEEILLSIKQNLWNNIKNKLPKLYEEKIYNELKQWKEYSYKLIDDRVTFLNRYIVPKNVMKDVNENLDYRFRKIKDIGKNILEDGFLYYYELNNLINDNDDIKDFNLYYMDDSFIKFKLEFETIFSDILLTSICMFIPLINIFTSWFMKDISKDELKSVVNKKYNELMDTLPNIIDEFSNKLEELDILKI